MMKENLTLKKLKLFDFMEKNRNKKKILQKHYAIMNLKLIKNKLYRELVLCANLFNV